MDSSGINSFDAIPAARFGFEKFPRSSEIFFLFFLSSRLILKYWQFSFSPSFQIIIIIHTLKLFTSAIADGFSLESEWQQVFSSLQDSSQYSGRSQ